MNKHSLRPLCGLLLLIGLAAPRLAAQEAPAGELVVSAGQIRLDGIVRSLDAGGHGLSVDVSAVTAPDGKTTRLAASRIKAVTLTPQTRLHAAGDVGETLTLDDFAVGDAVALVGADSGAGTKLAAGEVARLTDTPDEPQPLRPFRDGKFGLIDRTGKIVVPPKYDVISPFSDGLAAAADNRNIASLWLDTSGQEVRRDVVTGFRPYHSGLAIANDYQAKHFGYKDKTGRMVISLPRPMGEDFHAGFALLQSPEGVYFIDRAGKPLSSDRFEVAGDFHEGRAAVQKGGKWGLIDRAGNVIVAPQYDLIGNFHEGLAAIKLGSQEGCLDRDGHMVLPLREGAVGEFHEGLAAISIPKPVPEGAAPTADRGTFGYIDRAGKTTIPLQYGDAFPFNQGRARVLLNGKWGFIDHAGKSVISPQFDQIGDFEEGLASVQKGDKWGFIDRTGALVIPAQYSYTTGFQDGLADVWFDTAHKAYIDPAGHIVWQAAK